MSATEHAPSQALPVRRERTKVPSVSSKVRDAITAMVWDGLPRKAAAEHAGISEHGLYKALRTAHVKAFYKHELEVLRESERARNIHRLTQIRDAADNMPAVQAIKLLEQLGEDENHGNSRQQTPGLIIQVVGTATVSAAPMQAIEAQPAQPDVIDHQADGGTDD